MCWRPASLSPPCIPAALSPAPTSFRIDFNVSIEKPIGSFLFWFSWLTSLDPWLALENRKRAGLRCMADSALWRALAPQASPRRTPGSVPGSALRFALRSDFWDWPAALPLSVSAQGRLESSSLSLY